MEDVRLIIGIFSDVALEHATGEALLRARTKTDDLPPTIWLSKVTKPYMIIFDAGTPKDYVNIQKCEEYGVSIARGTADVRELRSVIYRDMNSWEVHFFDYTTSPLLSADFNANHALFSKIMINFFAGFGISARLEGNNLMVGDKKIGYSDPKILYKNRIFWYDSNVLQDFPFDIVKQLYGISPENLPTPERITTLKRELGKYVPDKEVIARIKASFQSVFISTPLEGELTDLEKEIRDKAYAKHSDSEWILQGDTILKRARLHKKSLFRLETHLTLHGEMSDYFRPVTRYCQIICPFYQECVAQTVPAKTVKDQLEFCRRIANSLPGDIVEAIEILEV